MTTPTQQPRSARHYPTSPAHSTLSACFPLTNPTHLTPATTTMTHPSQFAYAPFSASSSSASSSSTKPSCPKAAPENPGRPPRPPNSFIIYRKEQVANYPKLTTAELSRILGEKWYNEPPERKAHYAKLAKEAEQKHALQYPEYKYRPAKRGTGKKARAMRAAAVAAVNAVSEQNLGLFPPAPLANYGSHQYSSEVHSSIHPYMNIVHDGQVPTAPLSRRTERSTGSSSSKNGRRSGRPTLRASPFSIGSTLSSLTPSYSLVSSSTQRPYHSLAAASSLFFDIHGSTQWSVPLNTASPMTTGVKCEDDASSWYLNQLLNADMTAVMSMSPPHETISPSNSGEMIPDFLMANPPMISPPMPRPSASTPMFSTQPPYHDETPLQFLLDMEVPLPMSTSLSGNTTVAAQDTIFDTAGFASPYSTLMTCLPCPIPFPSQGGGHYALSTLKTESPFMTPSLMEQDMIISPVLSTCSSFSPSMSTSSLLLENHGGYDSTVLRSQLRNDGKLDVAMVANLLNQNYRGLPIELS